MGNRWKNLGMWASIVVATGTALTGVANTTDNSARVTILVTWVMTVAGIISNPKEGIGYLDTSNK